MTANRDLPLSGGFFWAGGIEDTFIPQERPGLRALEEYELTQHYEQWRADLDRAASLGITMLRWGVPWYRVESQPGVFDWSWIDEVLDYMINTLHIQPIVDLMHYGTPLWLEGSFVDPTYPERVAAYEGAFAERYRDLVRYYTPLNEPTVNADQCGRLGIWPPYLTGDKGFVQVLLPIARGMQLSVQAIRAADPDAIFITAEAMGWSRAADPGAQEAATFREQSEFLAWDLVSGLVDQQHPLYGWLIQNGATEEQLAVLRENPVEQDVFGANFYPWSAVECFTNAEGAVEQRRMPRDGTLLADVLRRCYEHTGKPVCITETSANEDITGRAEWMRETINAVRIARAAGIPVIGYTWFPIITMIDWEYRLATRPLADYLLYLGLWDSYFDEGGILERHETPLVARYREFVERGEP